MKKILLLLVSGMLILSLAGSAMAATPQIRDKDGFNVLSDTEVPLVRGEILNLSYYVTYEATDGSSDTVNSPYTYDVDIVALNGGSAGDITVLRVPSSFTLLNSSSGGTGLFMDQDAIALKLSSGAPIGAKYTVSIGDLHVPLVISATTTVESIPEFPTVALPVAAILGLVFIFGRKKEGL